MKSLLSLLLSLLLIGSVFPTLADTTDSPIILTAINVGKGDCLLLECGDALYMIDTGKTDHWGQVSAALRERNINHLTGVIITHADKDHAGGVYALSSSSIAIDGWYTAPWCEKYKDSKNPILLAAAARGEQVTRLHAGDALPFGPGSLTVIGPIEEGMTENDNSLVLLAKSGSGAILLAGDMELPEEDTLLDAGVLSPVTVLKVANHADGDATSMELLQTLRPQIAVISTNQQEEPDTPDRRVLQNLRTIGAATYITQDTPGAVQVIVQGASADASLVDHQPWPATISGIRIASKDPSTDTITLKNTSAQTVDCSHWFLYSSKGEEIFVFPVGTTIPSDGSLTISSLSSPRQGDLVWPETKVWNAKKADAAALCDAYGRMIDTMP